jgi:hypothetical protein
MKLHVISNNEGKVLGTYRSTPSPAGTPLFGGFTALEGQKIQEVEVPEAVFGIKNTTELHKALEKHMQN